VLESEGLQTSAMGRSVAYFTSAEVEDAERAIRRLLGEVDGPVECACI
jgi:hypothetical protein